MDEFLPIRCPFCGESFQTPLDAGEGSTEFTVDCEVCCRPLTVTVHIRGETVEDVRVASE